MSSESHVTECDDSVAVIMQQVIVLKYVLLQQSDDLHTGIKASVSCFVLCTIRRISAGTPKAGKGAVKVTE